MISLTKTCAICGAPILGRHFVNEYGQRYCATHRHPNKCVWCGRVGALTVGLSVARCNECSALCIDNDEQFRRLRNGVLDVLAEWIGTHRLGDVPASMSGGMLIAGRSRRIGLTHAEGGSATMDVRVRITPGMPEVLAGAVLMHEYGHVLMRVDPRSLAPWPKPRQLAHDEEEGACEVLAAEWLVRQTSSHAARELRRLVENKDPVYGDGYRKMKQRRAQYHDVSEWVNAELLGQRSSKVKQSRIK